jgi:hypothetical protein
MSSAVASAAALFLPLLAAAGDGVCPRPTAVASVLRGAAASCPAAGSPLGLRGRHAGVVEVSLAVLSFTITPTEILLSRLAMKLVYLIFCFQLSSRSRQQPVDLSMPWMKS